MNPAEIAFNFCLEGDELVGILHPVVGQTAYGVVMIVGGPQYRVGGHRHYVMLARSLAAAGIPVLRYDYRGIGDSSGRFRGFEDLDDDIRTGIDAFLSRVEGLKRVVLWGLCESASAIAFYASSDPRVAGIVLVNPYASTVGGKARTVLSQYYLQRFCSPAFWRRLLGGHIAIGGSLKSFAAAVGRAMGGSTQPAEVTLDKAADDIVEAVHIRPPDRQDLAPLPERMALGLEKFTGPILFVLSGNDLTAKEFLAAARSRRWTAIFARKSTARLDIPLADHTFSRRVWVDGLAAGAQKWLASW